MTAEEHRQAFAFLESALNESGLSWVTNQVAEQIRFGKTTTRSVRSRPDVPEDLAIFELSDKRRRQVQIPATQEYSDRERLEILCSAIEQALIAPIEMEATLRARLDRTDPSWTELRLVRTDAGDRPELVIGRKPDQQTARNIGQLHGLLKMLRQMI